MDLGAWLGRNWAVVSQNPATFIVFALIVGGATVAVTKGIMGAALEAARERLAAAQDQVAQLKEQRSELLARLEQHGENIAQLRRDLDALPRVHVAKRGPRPNEGKDGDLWVQVGNDSAGGRSGRPPRQNRHVLGELEKAILGEVAKRDGQPADLRVVRANVDTTNLRMEAALHRLADLKLLESYRAVDDPDDVALVLTPAGRQYAIDNGLA